MTRMTLERARKGAPAKKGKNGDSDDAHCKGKVVERERRATTLERSSTETTMTTVARTEEVTMMTISEKEREENLERVMATMTLVWARDEKEVTMMTPERERGDSGMETKWTLMTMTMVRGAREAKEVTAMSILEREREKTLERSRRGDANDLPTTLFWHKQVWIMMCGWSTYYERVFWKNPL